MLGRISTSVQVVNYGAIPLGALLAGLAAESFGTRTGPGGEQHEGDRGGATS